MLGKTATAEFAGVYPAQTVNPLDTSRTPGGSSSGSAAAVADFMVPFALGTQTGGSVLRPAAFCGVVGFKPSFGAYSIAGMKPAAHSFDTIGIIARSVEDVILVNSSLMHCSMPGPLNASLRVGLFRSHLWGQIDRQTQDLVERAFQAFADAGAYLYEIETPDRFEEIIEHRSIINAYERARGLASELDRTPDSISQMSRGIGARGFDISGERYFDARRAVDAFRVDVAAMFTGVDVLLTSSTMGEAPKGLSSTGDPRIQEIWSMLHLPAITIPFDNGTDGLPIGVQLVAPRYADNDLLSAAKWASEIFDTST
jgi:Asp-tRNA(Asn)/Glu-tRNA(Gln) amidotransferase A subunit family amidase